jgi:superfamily II DNA or RNA helicase
MSDAAVDLTVICQSFPSLPTPLVPRDHFIDAIDDLLATENTDVALVEGAPESGKTVFAAQFARRHPTRTISLFLRGTSVFEHDPLYVRQQLILQRCCP